MYYSVIIWLFYNASQSSNETSFHLKKKTKTYGQTASITTGMEWIKVHTSLRNAHHRTQFTLILKMCEMGAGILNKVKTVLFLFLFFYIKLIFRCDCVHLQIAFLIWQLLSKQSIYFYKVHGGDRRVGSSFF